MITLALAAVTARWLGRVERGFQKRSRVCAMTCGSVVVFVDATGKAGNLLFRYLYSLNSATSERWLWRVEVRIERAR